MFFKKSKKFQLDIDTANASLQNILAACDKAPNTIPFDKIVLRQKFNSKVYTALLLTTAIILALTLLVPFIIVPACQYTEKLFPPAATKLTEDYVDENILHLKFSGKKNIIYGEVYLETLTGERIEALSFDISEGTVCFPYFDDTESNIYIPLYSGETLHFLLSPQ